jgi:hypothetical protein
LSPMKSSDGGDKPPYNSDPMDQPVPESNIGAWAREMERFVLSNPQPMFTWAGIQEAARVEREARLHEFAFQKNFQMVDWFLDNPVENLPDDLLVKTQGYTRNNWEVI